MLFSSQRLPICWAGVCIALVGAAYCALQAAPLPLEIPCPGTGCRLFRDFSIFGISLWWFGFAYFAAMVPICLRRARVTALFLAGAALIIDGLLLIVMLATASCVSCLGGGLLIGLSYYVIRKHSYSRMTSGQGPSIILLAWSGLFIAALSFAGTEHLGPWRIAGEDNAERRVYFSPSCPACRDAITVFAGNATLIPVVERDSDYAAILTMREALKGGKTMIEALDIARRAVADGTAQEPAFPENILFRIRLLRNQAEVLRLGFRQLPLIMVNGMPQSMREGTAPTARPSSSGGTRASGMYSDGTDRRRAGAGGTLPQELIAPLDSCGDNSPEPCDPPPQ